MREIKRDIWGLICEKRDLEENGLLGKKSFCCNVQVIVCGINNRAIDCRVEEGGICDELMCRKCKKHCLTLIN